MGRGVRELGGRMRELHRQIGVLQADLVHTVGEFDAAQGYELDECRCTQSWLRYQLRLHPGRPPSWSAPRANRGSCPRWTRP